ncbi:hypothetical protein [Limnohabitans sp. DM1]|uniref:hypothetical protein n=1 Tax=Limnohabitans sp. DM1 TaxID=1597955 RepID=UPI000A57B115|nr:hypothetical protein [Limnohabitans sp. DM1]
MSSAFNLLHYPNLAQQQGLRHRRVTGLLGCAVGVALAWGWVWWQAAKTEALLTEQRQLQSQMAERTQRLKVLDAQRALVQMQRLQRKQLSQIAQHQQIWNVWHQALLAEAQRSSLRLERLQAEGDKLELQGFAPSVSAMTAARQQLAEHWGQAVNLASLTATNTLRESDSARSAQVSFVWQVAWTSIEPPAEASGKAPAAAAAAPAASAAASKGGR